MLGRDAASELVHHVVDDGIDTFFIVAQKDFCIRTSGGLHVVVQIAIAQVAVVDQARAGVGLRQQGIGQAHKLRYSGHGNGDVVFDVQPLLRLRQWNALADVPQGAGLGDVFRDHRVQDAAVFHGHFQQALEAFAGVGFRFLVRVF